MQTHFKRIAHASKIPLDKMLFFDNEARNVRSVSRLGVTCVHTPDGMTTRLFKEGLARFASGQG